jgi:excisionase family DNA binding protein
MSELPDKAFFRPDEVAEYYGVAVSTVYSWIAEGKLEAVRLAGRTTRISHEAIINLPKAANE